MDLPMPKPTTSTTANVTKYKALSFDVYGTLIEYKGHILRSFQPLLSRLPSSSPYNNTALIAPGISGSATVGSVEFLRLFQKEEDTIKLEKPLPRFDKILSQIWWRVAKRLDVTTSDEEAHKFGSEAVIASWPCFPGTLEALHALSGRYRLIALSNIDPFAWGITALSATSAIGNVEWWKIFTAADYGDEATRADDSKLETCVEYCQREGIGQDEILHVAQSLGHDHAPAKRLGLDSVWLIGDGPIWGKREESRMVLDKELVGYKWKAESLQDFAKFVDEEWSKVSPADGS